MTAPVLLKLFESLYLLALTSWVGSILFLSFGVAPIIFKVLDAQSASKFVRALFPRYYAWGAISAAIAVPAYIAVPLSFPEMRGPLVAVQALLLVFGALLMLYCGNALTPEINEARDAGPARDARFKALHRRSVRLNGLAMVIGVGLLVAFAVRSAPTTTGLVELPPSERTEYDADTLQFMNDVVAEIGQGEMGPSASKTAAFARSPLKAEAKQELWEMLAAQRRRNAVEIGEMLGETKAPVLPGPAAPR
ncbi:DUF4149 domain-containing protein [Isosphaeraceae bacterium EP7]